MQQDRYCRNCGQHLKPEDRFCAGCGRSVYGTAHVPTPEADVTVPQPAPSSQAPVTPPQEQQPSESQDATRNPMWGMLVVFLVLGTVKAAQEMPPAATGDPFFYRLGVGMAIPILLLPALTALLLLVGGVYYVTARKDGVTFREAIFNWPLMILASSITLLTIL